MTASFDNAALAYDGTFTNSAIGRLQRQQVYFLLEKILGKTPITSILEINCGTGEDAIWLSKHGISVTATDISENMIAAAKKKLGAETIAFCVADINRLAADFPEAKFDMIFSNFGGLNCLTPTEFSNFFQNSAALLSKKAKSVLVIMPKNTIWEQLYFLGKANFKNVFRRKKTNVLATVDGEKVPTYYYNPNDTIIAASSYYNVVSVKPIGFFVPPSYLEPLLKNKPLLASLLGKLDTAAGNFSFLSKYADHYLIILEKK